MTKDEKIASIKPEIAWAWAFRDFQKSNRWLLCACAEPSKELLMLECKPSPEAIPVRVLLTPVLPAKRSGHHRKVKP